MRVSFPDFWQPEKYLVYPLDKSYPYAIIWNRWANKKFPYQNRQHSTVVVHPTCNRKVVGSNPTAGPNETLEKSGVLSFQCPVILTF